MNIAFLTPENVSTESQDRFFAEIPITSLDELATYLNSHKEQAIQMLRAFYRPHATATTLFSMFGFDAADVDLIYETFDHADYYPNGQNLVLTYWAHDDESMPPYQCSVDYEVYDTANVSFKF